MMLVQRNIFMLFLATSSLFAQIDLSGNWQTRAHEDAQDRGAGPDAVSYMGLPLSADGRSRALSYSSSVASVPERQCQFYPPHYLDVGPQSIKIWSESEPATGAIVAWRISGVVDRPPLTIWMDGRPQPTASATHTYGGFTTGIWEGDTLTTQTTHVKEGYLRRNGVPSSDRVRITSHFTRHDNVLTITILTVDPINLTEPDILSRSWTLSAATISEVGAPCVPEAEVPSLQTTGVVPHYLPGRNPFINEVTKMYNIPVEAVMGGAETRYPEYRTKLKDKYVAPERCVRYCCSAGDPSIKCIRDGGGSEIPTSGFGPAGPPGRQ